MSGFFSDPIIRDFLNIIGPFLNMTWPFWFSLLLFPILESAWLAWRQELWRRATAWDMLEIFIPREVRKSPRAMEQVLAAIHALRNTPTNFMDYYGDGETTRWFSLEMVSFGGEIHFYIRTPQKLKGLVEAAFLSYYPDIELLDAEDYALKMPQNVQELYAQGAELFGSEMVLSKEDAYPIKTYSDFEAPEEEKTFDPIASFLEVLSNIKKSQTLAIQILITPKDLKWRDEWKALVDKLYKSEHSGPTDENEDKPARLASRSPGETDVLEAVEKNLSKPAFDTIIRYVYLSPKELFAENYPRRGVAGVFNQYSALDLNSFRNNFKVTTYVSALHWPYFFSKKRWEYRKERMLYDFHHRVMPPKTFMGKVLTSYPLSWNFSSKTFAINTECLATIFHPPIFLVLTGPHLHRVESRKSGPPSGLAIFGEESEIEKFQ